MPGKLINVRLNAQDAARAERLQADGIEISELVRGAIRDAFERRNGNGSAPRRSKRLLEQIFKDIPLPPDAPPHDIDTADRHAVQQYIREHLTRKSRPATRPARHKRAGRARRTA